MKKIIVISIALLLSLALRSQSKIKMTGGFGSPIINISQIGESTALTIGGGGGFIINSRLFIGGYGESPVTEPNPAETPYKNHHLEIGSGGLWLGYMQPLTGKHYVTLSAQLGFGRVYLLKNQALSFYDDVSYIRPILEYEYRFSKIFSLAAGMSWAFYNNFDIPVYEARDLSQPAANITFKLGWIQ